MTSFVAGTLRVPKLWHTECAGYYSRTVAV